MNHFWNVLAITAIALGNFYGIEQAVYGGLALGLLTNFGLVLASLFAVGVGLFTVITIIILTIASFIDSIISRFRKMFRK